VGQKLWLVIQTEAFSVHTTILAVCRFEDTAQKIAGHLAKVYNYSERFDPEKDCVIVSKATTPD
jgi:hypothetical protein